MLTHTSIVSTHRVTCDASLGFVAFLVCFLGEGAGEKGLIEVIDEEEESSEAGDGDTGGADDASGGSDDDDNEGEPTLWFYRPACAL